MKTHRSPFLSFQFAMLFMPALVGATGHFRHWFAGDMVRVSLVFFVISACLMMGYLVLWADLSPNWKARNLMALRDAYPPEAFGSRYFTGAMAVLATRLRRVFDQHYELNPNKILPSDRFVEDMAFCRSNSQVGAGRIEAFLREVQDEFGIEISPDEFAVTPTFKAMMELIQAKLEAKPREIRCTDPERPLLGDAKTPRPGNLPPGKQE